MAETPPAGPDGIAMLRRRAGAAAQVFVEDPAHPVVTPEDAHHLVRVLRLRPGEPVVAADGRGGWCMCRVSGPPGSPSTREEMDGAELLWPGEPIVREPMPRPSLTVAFALTKGERPDWVVQKLTELGVDHIVPLQTQRCVVRWEGERAARATTRLRKVAREAACQSRRCWLPEVTEVCTLDRLLSGDGWLAELGGRPPSSGATVVAVGPEGGWSPGELAAAAGRTVGLGPAVLRSETAAVVVGALLAGLRAGTVAAI